MGMRCIFSGRTRLHRFRRWAEVVKISFTAPSGMTKHSFGQRLPRGLSNQPNGSLQLGLSVGVGASTPVACQFQLVVADKLGIQCPILQTGGALVCCMWELLQQTQNLLC